MYDLQGQQGQSPYREINTTPFSQKPSLGITSTSAPSYWFVHTFVEGTVERRTVEGTDLFSLPFTKIKSALFFVITYTREGAAAFITQNAPERLSPVNALSMGEILHLPGFAPRNSRAPWSSPATATYSAAEPICMAKGLLQTVRPAAK